MSSRSLAPTRSHRKVSHEEDDNGTMVIKNDDSISKEFAKLLRQLGLKRPRLNFYSLRHIFETVAGESRDQVAVDYVMGHVDNSMAAHYRERIGDDRLKDVVDHVHDWLFG